MRAYNDDILHDYHVIHDSGANCGIFKNINILENIRISNEKATINGIGGNLTTNVIGTFNDRHDVYYHPDAVANILSQSAEKDNGATISYNNEKDEYTMTFEDDDTYVPLTFQRVGGLYCIDTSNMDEPYYTMHNSTTVRMNKLKYTKREVKRADEAMKLRRRLSFPADETIPHLQTIINIPTTRKDLARSVDIYGKDRNSIRGKATKQKTKTIYLESIYKPSDVSQHLNIDIFFIDGEGYLISVLTPLDFVQISRIQSRTSEALRAAVYHHLATAESEDYQVTHILCDGEKGFTAFFNAFRTAGYLINPAGPGQHVPIVERKIRLVKERIRAYLQSIPYQLMFSLLRYLVEYVTIMINFEPNSQREDPTSPYELFRGQKIDYKRQLRISFGDYAECTDPHVTSNTMERRTDPCIALLPLLNAQGSHLFYNLETRRTCMRDTWTELPFSEDILKRVNKLAARQRKKLRVQPNFAYEPVDEDNNFLEHIDDYNLYDDDPADISIDSSSDSDEEDDDDANDNNMQMRENIAEEIEENERIRQEIQAENALINDTEEYINPVDQHKPEDLYAEKAPIGALPTKRHQTRSKGPVEQPAAFKDGRSWVNVALKAYKRLNKALFHASLTVQQKNKFGVYSNMTVRQAIDKYGTQAKQAVMEELKQLIKLQVLKFHKADLLDPRTAKNILPSKTFVKVKFDPTGAFDKIKARLVGGGHRQKRYLYKETETSSPTISLVGLYIVALTAAHEGRTVITADVAGAYLRAFMKKLVLIKINQEESAMLVEMYPELEQYLDDQGKLTAECLKALYGLIESGKLWYDTIKEKLLKNGYVQNPYEPCTFNKWHADKQVQSTIGVYVDDLITTCKDTAIAESIVTWLESEFDELKVTRGDVHKFTGMVFDFRAPKKLKITMKKGLEDIIKRNKITGTVATPSTAELFQIDPESPRLDKEEAEKFHSEVASISYVVKRIKPECLTVTSFLLTRVHYSTKQDWSKLQRLLNYLAGTQDIPLTLEMDDGPIEIVANIDSSHASHGDYRGHTGIFITLGKGAIQAISTKQPINTKSSAESELVAASDGATPAINVLNIILCQGIEVKSLIIEQDNKSTLAMIANGRATGPTSRHINIRFFWLNDRLASGEISMRYVPTAEMTADLLTKHMEGSAFYKHRNTLLNLH